MSPILKTCISAATEWPFPVVTCLSNAGATADHTGLVLLFGLAEVVAEVEVTGWFGDWRCCVWDRDIFQVQEAELDFHREENL